MKLSRRALLRTLLQGAGAALVLGGKGQAVEVGSGEASGPLTVRVTRPFDAETPVREFASVGNACSRCNCIGLILL
ncbi:MAG TPA: hypothetical protein PLT27_07425, partial [Nitrospira sp.]|nr:hypothetical protein [Nitrospira sp.]